MLNLFYKLSKFFAFFLKVTFGLLSLGISFFFAWVIFDIFYFNATEKIVSESWHFNREGIYGLPAYEFRPTEEVRRPFFVSIACFSDDEYKINLIPPFSEEERVSPPRTLLYEILEPDIRDSYRFFPDNVLYEGEFNLIENISINSASPAHIGNLPNPMTNMYELSMGHETGFIGALNVAGGNSSLRLSGTTYIENFEFGWHEIGTRLSGACNETAKSGELIDDFLLLAFALCVTIFSAFRFYITPRILSKVLYFSILLPFLVFSGTLIIVLFPLIFNFF